MKKLMSVLFVCCSMFVVTGCDSGGETSAITDNVEKSAVEQYEANLEASQKDLGAAGTGVEEDTKSK